MSANDILILVAGLTAGIMLFYAAIRMHKGLQNQMGIGSSG